MPYVLLFIPLTINNRSVHVGYYNDGDFYLDVHGGYNSIVNDVVTHWSDIPELPTVDTNTA